MDDILIHYGVQGQKHGVRRWQYEDGSLTPAGRIHYGVGIKEYSRDSEKANDIYKTLSKKEKHYLTGETSVDGTYERTYQNKDDYQSAVYSSIMAMKDVPVSMLDIYEHRNKKGLIAIATRNEDQYRGAGLAKEAVKKAVEWFDNHSDLMELEWSAFTENTRSWKLAEKLGFERDDYASNQYETVYRKMKDERKREYEKRDESYKYDNDRVQKEAQYRIDNLKDLIRIKQENKKQGIKDSLVSQKFLNKDIAYYNLVAKYPERFLNDKGQLFYKGRLYPNLFSLVNDLEMDKVLK